jgi:crotonobetainyl-CoA:carnitine CoA-transferase CaiB-like acyl-CoA transferase
MPEGRDIALRLIEWADVVMQSFRPGVTAKLGLDYEDAKRVNPSVIYASMSAYPRGSKLEARGGMDVSVQARSGVMAITGESGGGPVKPGVSAADFGGGLSFAVGILGALMHRERTGEGQELNVSLMDAMRSMVSNFSVAVLDGGARIAPMGSGHPQIVPYRAFVTSDGYVVISGGTNRLFRALCAALQEPEWATDPRFSDNVVRVKNRDVLEAMISAKTAAFPTGEWLQILDDFGVPCSPVNTLEQGFTDPVTLGPESLVEVNHPAHGPLHLVGIPFQYSATRCSIRRPPALLGEDSYEILTDLLDMPPDEITRLAASKVIGVVEQAAEKPAC